MSVPLLFCHGWGGVLNLDGNSDPRAFGALTSVASSEPAWWRSSGGASGQAGDGYIALTDARNSQTTTLVFADLDPGFATRGFTFECDLRVGGGSESPADGLSISFVSADDPLVAAADSGGQPQGPWSGTDAECGHPGGGGLPEEGTSTGLAIALDTWQSSAILGVQDVVGLSVRVEGKLIAQLPVPLRSGNLYPGGEYDPLPYHNAAVGSAGYRSSLQTGSRNVAAIAAAGLDPQSQVPWGQPNWDLWVTHLAWEPLRVEWDDGGWLRLFWKGVEVTPPGGLFTPLTTVPNRLVLGARTGGANQVHHLDNLRVTTTRAPGLFVPAAAATPVGFTLLIADSDTVRLESSSVRVRLDGVEVAPRVETRGRVTKLTHEDFQNPPPPGSEHVIELTASDARGVSWQAVRTYTTPAYTLLPPTFAVSGVDLSQPGFRIRGDQRTPSLPSSIQRAEQQLRGKLSGDDTLDRSAFPGGTHVETGVINYNQNAPSSAGCFAGDRSIPGVPGLTGSTDNVALEILTYLHFPAPGVYTLIVNSDDGFRTTCHPGLREQLNSVLVAEYDGGRAASDTAGTVVVSEAGFYPLRTVWFEGGGDASLEWSAITPDQERRLINDSTPGALKAYRAASSDAPAVVAYTEPTRGAGGAVDPWARVVMEIDRGSAAITSSSIQLRVNGELVVAQASQAGNTTTVVYAPTRPYPAGQVAPTRLTFTAGDQTYEGTLSFPVARYPTVPSEYRTAVGTGADRGLRWRTYQTAVAALNTIDDAEARLRGDHGPNLASPEEADAEGYFAIDTVNFEMTGAAMGTFYANAPGPLNVADRLIPGIPGLTGATDNVAAEALAYLEFPAAGVYRMGVHSDDGFAVSVGTGLAPKLLALGAFDGGRAAADTVFAFTIEEPGVYQFRLLWFQGVGGASVEWFTVNPDGSRALINGTQPGALRGYRRRAAAEPPFAGLSVRLVRGWNLIGNPLDTDGNTLSEILPAMPGGAVVFLWDPDENWGWRNSSVYLDGEGWRQDLSLPITTGAFLLLPESQSVTYQGRALEEPIDLPLISGLNLVSLPYAPDLAADQYTAAGLGSVPEGTTLFVWDGTAYTLNHYDFGEWSDPTMPLPPGSGFFLLAPNAFTITWPTQPARTTVSLDLPAGFSLIANPLNRGNNSLNEVLPAPPANTVLHLVDASGQPSGRTSIWTSAQGWVPNEWFPPGTAAYLQLPTAQTVRFQGQPIAVTQTNRLGPGLHALGIPYPPASFQLRDVSPPPEGTTFYKWHPSGAYRLSSYDLGEWSDPMMTFPAGEGFLVQCPGNWNWVVQRTGRGLARPTLPRPSPQPGIWRPVSAAGNNPTLDQPGKVYFSNFAEHLDVPAGIPGQMRADAGSAGRSIQVQLFAAANSSTAPADEADWQEVGWTDSQGSGQSPVELDPLDYSRGYFYGGPVGLTGFSPNVQLWLQIRLWVWDPQRWSDYASAEADPLAWVLKSNPFPVINSGIGANPPVVFSELASFAVRPGLPAYDPAPLTYGDPLPPLPSLTAADVSGDLQLLDATGNNVAGLVLPAGDHELRLVFLPIVSVARATAGVTTAIGSAERVVTIGIAPRPVRVTNLIAEDKVYDGTTQATLDGANATLEGVLSGDTVVLRTDRASGAFADPDVGANKPVTVTGLSLDGPAAGNYMLTPPTLTADIQGFIRLSLTRPAAGARELRILVEAAPHMILHAEYSEDLAFWQTLGPSTGQSSGATGIVELTHPDWSGSQERFYRVWSP